MRTGKVYNKCLAVLEKNWKEGPGFGYTRPALWKYPHQWLWDSCFAAIIWSRINPERAKKEIETLLSAQKPNGFLPHIIKWPSGATSNLTQPPVVALALEEIFKNTGDENFVKRHLPNVVRYFDWLRGERDPKNKGLVFIVHPWESTDASPTLVATSNPILGYWQLYQNLWRKNFRKVDVLFNCLYAQGLRSLARLTKEGVFDQRAEKVEKEVLKLPYDGTASALLPIIFESISRERVKEIVDRIGDPKQFGLPFLVPFVAKDHPSFDPIYRGLLWRGPTWININWFLVRGLYQRGQKKAAKKIAQKSVELVAREGLWEFYNPLTGKGQGQRDYTWSALVLDMLSLEKK